MQRVRAVLVFVATFATFLSALEVLQAPPAFADYDRGDVHAADFDLESSVDFSRWMTNLADSTSLAELSIPGTHDSFAYNGGQGTQTQTLCGADNDNELDDDCPITAQLKAGIRSFDVRLKCDGDGDDGATDTTYDEAVEGKLRVYHGSARQRTTFEEDIVSPLDQFLTDNPGETVILKVRNEEYNDDGDEGDGCNDAEFAVGVEAVWQRHKSFAWQPDRAPKLQNGSPNPNYDFVQAYDDDGAGNQKLYTYLGVPTLRRVRGKVVWTARFDRTTTAISDEFDDAQFDADGPLYDSFGHYKVCVSVGCGSKYEDSDTDEDFLYWDDKAREVRDRLIKANENAKNNDNFVLHYTELACSTGVVPRDCASGGGLGLGPGHNERAMQFLWRNLGMTRAGVLVSDFPGEGLIGTILGFNLKYLDPAKKSEWNTTAKTIMQNAALGVEDMTFDQTTEIKGVTESLYLYLARAFDLKTDQKIHVAASSSPIATVADDTGLRFDFTVHGVTFNVWSSDPLGGDPSLNDAVTNFMQANPPACSSLEACATAMRASIANAFQQSTWAVTATDGPLDPAVRHVITYPQQDTVAKATVGGRHYTVQGSSRKQVGFFAGTRADGTGPYVGAENEYRVPAGTTATTPITVSLLSLSGAAKATSASPTNVNLTTSSPTGFFTLAQGQSAADKVNAVSIPAGASSVVLYYGDPTVTTSSATAPKLTAAIPGQQPYFTASVFVGPGAPTALRIDTVATKQVVDARSTFKLTITRVDEAGNAVPRTLLPDGTDAPCDDLTYSSTSPTGFFTDAPDNIQVPEADLPPLCDEPLSVYYGDLTVGTPTLTVGYGTIQGTTSHEVIGFDNPAGRVDFLPTALNNAPVTDKAEYGPFLLGVFGSTGAVNDIVTRHSGISVDLSGGLFSLTKNGPLITQATIPAGQGGIALWYGNTVSDDQSPDQQLAVAHPTGGLASSGLLHDATHIVRMAALAPTQTAIANAEATASDTATNPIRVGAADKFGNVVAEASPRVVQLASKTSANTRFALTAGGAAVQKVTIPANTQGVTVFFGDPKAATHTVTATSTGYATGQGTILNRAAAFDRIVVRQKAPYSTVASATPNLTLNLDLQDRFGNLTPLPRNANASGVLQPVTASFTTADFARFGSATPSTTGTTDITDLTSVPVSFGSRTTGARSLALRVQQNGAGTNIARDLTVPIAVSPGPPSTSRLSPATITNVIGAPTAPLTISVLDAVGNPSPAPTPTVFNLSSNSSTGTFSLTDGGPAITSVTVGAGTSSATFYFRDTQPSSRSISAANQQLGTATATAVTQAPTSVSVTTSASPVPFGEAVTYTASVTAPSDVPTPTGTVEILDGADVIGSGAVTDGSFFVTVLRPAVGDHPISARYLGDEGGLYAASATAAPAFTQRVDRGGATASLSASKSLSLLHESVTFTVAVAPADATLPRPTGAVGLYRGTTLVGTGTLDANGQAAISLATLPVGANSLVARFVGDTNYASDDSAVLTHTVTYGVRILDEPNPRIRTGRPRAMRVRLVDVNDVVQSAPGVSVAVVGMTPPPGTFATTPSGSFRIQSRTQAYCYDLRTGRFPTGSYDLLVRLSSDDVVRRVPFRIVAPYQSAAATTTCASTNVTPR